MTISRGDISKLIKQNSVYEQEEMHARGNPYTRPNSMLMKVSEIVLKS